MVEKLARFQMPVILSKAAVPDPRVLFIPSSRLSFQALSGQTQSNKM